jgi:hypothetical protein
VLKYLVKMLRVCGTTMLMRHAPNLLVGVCVTLLSLVPLLLLLLKA